MENRTGFLRTLAVVLTSPVLFLASCNGVSMVGFEATKAFENRARQVPIEDVAGFTHSVAIVAAPDDSSSQGSKRLTYWLVKNPQEDLVKFRRNYPEYGFLPPANQGHISHPEAESYVEYWVLHREPGEAVIKTHMNHYVLMGLDTRATYEATASDIRLISYKYGSDLGIWPIVGIMPACLLAIFGEILLGRIARAELRSGHPDASLWVEVLARSKGKVRRAESRYIARRIKQLKRGNAPAPTPPLPGPPPNRRPPPSTSEFLTARPPRSS